MDTLSDAELAQRVSDLRNSDAGKSMLEKISTGSNEDFSAEELSVHNRVSVFLAEQDRRAVKSQFAAHLQSAGSFQQDSVHAKLDELLAANGPARRPLPGAKCDFKDKSGNDNNAAKRTWEFADLADKKFFEASQSVAKLSKVEVPDSIAEEVKASLAKAEETLAEGEDQRGEFEEGSPKSFPRGRLRARVPFWKLFCNAVVLAWITFGVSLPWLDGPPPARIFSNSELAVKEDEFVTEAVASLVESGAAYPVDFTPIVVSPLSVAYRDLGPGVPPKKRLIWNGRYVNSFLFVQKFKYESLEMVKDLLSPGGYMWCYDFTSGYHHVELHPDSHTYVAFEWHGQYYCYAVLPFGLAVAPYIFTRITRELAMRWRSRGVKLVHYLDDFIFFGVLTAGSLAAFLSEQAVILSDLDSAGFLLNLEKSVFEPVQRLLFLGMGIDSVRGGALASGFWTSLHVSSRDPLEQALLKSMKSGMVGTRAPSTWNDSYSGIISRYKAFCAARVPPRVPVPASPMTVCLFLQLVASDALSYASVKSASGALFTLHEMALVPPQENPTKHPLAKGIRTNAKRRIGLKLKN
ncbi:hypothetical protein CYMTET_3446 [Cymbomonas tetramitiformis]|uniref:Reverse transcriptase domain-containing protein n=1 Tax=Cymbomonas tetramitiformis TaxID=36881 RepID=A0AAE0H327_9CHLO|nr:hypothetical protein CYMTET_3446 [Cymbomonas tetramitiformis]